MTTAITATPAQSGRPHSPRALLPILRTVAGVLSTSVLALAAVVFAFLAVGPHLLHYRTITMLTGSMNPTIRPGDVVVDTPEPAAALRVGQIVTYHIPVLDHHIESHRVATITHNANGTLTFTTKGDANPAPDPWKATVSAKATMWRVRQVVPGIGNAIRDLRSPSVEGPLRWGGLGAIAVLAVAVIWRRPTDAGDNAGGEDNVDAEDRAGADGDADAHDHAEQGTYERSGVSD